LQTTKAQKQRQHAAAWIGVILQLQQRSVSIRRSENSNFVMIYFAFVMALVYFLFQLNVLFSAISGGGRCVYPTWQLHKYDLVTPFYLFLFIVVLLFCWYFYLSVTVLSRRPNVEWFFVLVGGACFYFWFVAFDGMWWLFEQERQAITKLEFFLKTGADHQLIDYYSSSNHFKHQCKL